MHWPKSYFVRVQLGLLFLLGDRNAIVFVIALLLISGKKEWEGEHRGRHLFACQPTVLSKRRLMTSCRRDEVVLTRLRLGHCGLASCLLKISKHPDGLCECGNIETGNHVLLSCSKYAKETLLLFADLF